MQGGTIYKSSSLSVCLSLDLSPWPQSPTVSTPASTTSPTSCLSLSTSSPSPTSCTLIDTSSTNGASLHSLRLQPNNSPCPPQATSILPSEPCLPGVIATSHLRPNALWTITLQAYPDDGSNVPVGCIVCKQSPHRESRNRGYIAMLSVHRNWRKRGIGRWSSDHLPASCSHLIAPATSLIRQSVEKMKQDGVQEVSGGDLYADWHLISEL